MRWDILGGKLTPGQVFNESEFTRLFGVSKTPVREALQRLKQEGFVRTIPSVGYEVVAVTLDDALELLEMRGIVEMAAVKRTIERITEKELDRLEELVQEPFVTQDKEAVVQWYKENTAFHNALAQACGNRRLARAVRETLEESQRLYFITTHADFNTAIAVTNHKRIVEALRDHDLERAIELLAWEVDLGAKMAVDGMTSQGTQSDP